MKKETLYAVCLKHKDPERFIAMLSKLVESIDKAKEAERMARQILEERL
jgi:hypothetical protein